MGEIFECGLFASGVMESDEWHVWDQVSPRSELVGDSYQHMEWLYVTEVQRGAGRSRRADRRMHACGTRAVRADGAYRSRR